MDLVTQATLYFFGALFAGGMVGALIGKLTRFELGLGAGLLIPGAVAAWFAWQCLDAFQAYDRAGANTVAGEVLAIEDRPVNESGSVTTPVPVVRFTAPDRSTHTVRGPAASGMKVGDEVDVIYEPADPTRSRVGQRSQLRGGAIAMMLFGTFPLSLGLWFVYAGLHGTREERRLAAAHAAGRKLGALRERLLRDSVFALHLGMFAAIVWIAVGTGSLERRFVLGFGAIAAVLAGYALRCSLDPRATPSTIFAFVVLGVNFGVWAFAINLLL